uniref:Uncharacterized protein n=1 Tax=Setaria italica TaxID=4555 RepID=K3ZBG5_SETIT
MESQLFVHCFDLWSPQEGKVMMDPVCITTKGNYLCPHSGYPVYHSTISSTLSGNHYIQSRSTISSQINKYMK